MRRRSSSGSILEPIPFTVYVSPISRLLTMFGASFHNNVEDTMCAVMSLSTDAGLDRRAKCTSALRHLYWFNNMQLDPDKSDFAFFLDTTAAQAISPSTFVTDVGCTVAVFDRLKVFGGTLYSSLAFEYQIDDNVKACIFHFRPLHHERQSLSKDTDEKTEHCTVGLKRTIATRC